MIVPALVLAFGFDAKLAVASSLVAVVATSAGAGSSYAGSGQLNMRRLRLAHTLEIATTLGGLTGELIAVVVAGSVLDGLFAAVMLVTALLVFRGRDEHGEPASAAAPAMAASAGATSPAPALATPITGDSSSAVVAPSPATSDETGALALELGDRVGGRTASTSAAPLTIKHAGSW